MKILITGANGFIGTRLAKVLLESGEHEVIRSGRRAPSAAMGGTFSAGDLFAVADLTDKSDAERVTRDVDVIVHCAGKAGTWGSYDEFYRDNVFATGNLLQAARKNNVPRLINLSSPSVYFDFKDQLNLKETDRPVRFSNPYAQTKYEAEQLVRGFHNETLQTVSLRPRSVIGAGDPNTLPRLIRLHEQGRLRPIGAGENVVDITTIGNLIDAILLCLKAPPEAMGENYNISNGAPIRFWSFVDLLLKKAGLAHGGPRKALPYGPVMALARLNETVQSLLGLKKEPAFLPISVGVLTFSMTLDIRKARNRLGYEPRLTTEQGIEEFLAART